MYLDCRRSRCMSYIPPWVGIQFFFSNKPKEEIREKAKIKISTCNFPVFFLMKVKKVDKTSLCVCSRVHIYI